MRRVILYLMGWISYALGDGITAYEAWTVRREPLDARELAEGIRFHLNVK